MIMINKNSNPTHYFSVLHRVQIKNATIQFSSNLILGTAKDSELLVINRDNLSILMVVRAGIDEETKFSDLKSHMRGSHLKKS